MTDGDLICFCVDKNNNYCEFYYPSGWYIAANKEHPIDLIRKLGTIEEYKASIGAK